MSGKLKTTTPGCISASEIPRLLKQSLEDLAENRSNNDKLELLRIAFCRPSYYQKSLNKCF